MRTACFPSSARAGSAQLPQDADPPLPDADPLRLDADPPPTPWMQTTPSDVTCDICWEASPSSPMNRIIDACKNITLPQTLFAGGKYTSQMGKLIPLQFNQKYEYLESLPPAKFLGKCSVGTLSYNLRWRVRDFSEGVTPIGMGDANLLFGQNLTKTAPK